MEAGDRQPNGSEEPTVQPQGDEPTPPHAEAPTQPQAEASPPPRATRRLFRSRDDRVLGGVAGGLGRYFNVDAIFFRIGLIALLVLGGAGALVYFPAWLLIPKEPEAGEALTPPADNRPRGVALVLVVLLLLISAPLLLGAGMLAAGLLVPLALLVGAGVVTWWLVSGEGPSGDAGDIARRSALGVGVLILCLLLALGAAWGAAIGGGGVVAAIVIAAGVAILAGAFLRPVRWLVLPAVVVALAAGSVSAAGIELDGGVGDRHYTPASAADLENRYELGMGELVVDLRDTELPPGDTPLRTEVGLGEIRLIVPDDVCVASSAEIGAGEVAVFDRTSSGVDVDWVDDRSAPRQVSRLVVDAEIGLGALSISHDEREPDRAVFDRSGEGYADRSGDENTDYARRVAR
jgi:phage shock protein PspC (stress-responsive transcriptional regulator)